MKGYRTLAFNGVVLVASTLLTYVAGINWSEYVSAELAIIIVALANAGLRIITTTPVGESE